MRVVIIGAGTMGSGIAQAFLGAEEYSVTLCDINEELARRGKDKIDSSLRKLAAKGKITDSAADAMLSRVRCGLTDLAADCDLIVEAVIEDIRAKKEIFHALQYVCEKEAIFTSNTSSLSLTELSQGLDRPVIGMHFFNPAPVMKLVEVVAGMHADPEMVLRVAAIAESIGKTPVVVKDGAGFVVNRILIPMINEAIGIYSDGLATAGGIDTAMKLGANHPMGPLELGDLIGLDVCLAIMEVLHNEFGDDKYRPHPLLRKMVRAGLLGKKAGEGFYSYNSNNLL